MDNKRVRENTIPDRIPLSEQNKSVMSVPSKPGFVRRWVNDDPSKPGIRINAFLRAGWRIVTDDVSVGTPGIVNQNTSLGSGARKHATGGLTIVLMEIEQKYYDEDQANKMLKVDKIERAIIGGSGLDERIKIGSTAVEEQ